MTDAKINYSRVEFLDFILKISQYRNQKKSSQKSCWSSKEENP